MNSKHAEMVCNAICDVLEREQIDPVAGALYVAAAAGILIATMIPPEHQDELVLLAQAHMVKKHADGAEHLERNPHVLRQQ